MDASACPASGSLRGQTVLVDLKEFQLLMDGPCVSFAEPSEIALSFRYRLEALPGGSIEVGAYAYPTGDCSGPATDAAATTFPPYSEWHGYSDTLFVPAVGSMRWVARAYGPFTSTVWVDEIRATIQPHLFLDDFDGGGTCRWSLSAE